MIELKRSIVLDIIVSIVVQPVKLANDNLIPKYQHKRPHSRLLDMDNVLEYLLTPTRQLGRHQLRLIVPPKRGRK